MKRNLTSKPLLLKFRTFARPANALLYPEVLGRKLTARRTFFAYVPFLDLIRTTAWTGSRSGPSNLFAQCNDTRVDFEGGRPVRLVDSKPILSVLNTFRLSKIPTKLREELSMTKSRACVTFVGMTRSSSRGYSAEPLAVSGSAGQTSSSKRSATANGTG